MLDALRQTAPGSGLVRPLTAAPDLDGWAIMERLLTDLASLRDQLWLVLDDLRELDSDQARRQLELLVMRAPAELRFVMATRHDVRLGLHRLRLEGELTEIRADDLRFTAAEARALFEAAGGELPGPTLIRQRADGGRVPAGRGAGPAERAGAAAAAADQRAGTRQRGAGRSADGRLGRGAGAA